ncbi:uncharacterized protein SCHCODRAFT_02488050 [Schizophyllum commune H4-8]|nr:uncharacterized protein SCHCODRAFT_02488050 [Schizophyllum commune H4-8]KAI5897383.1 hypothetical protein SCHCODRAFT_02488050 [Schizophyllum commune H4-8]
MQHAVAIHGDNDLRKAIHDFKKIQFCDICDFVTDDGEPAINQHHNYHVHRKPYICTVFANNIICDKRFYGCPDLNKHRRKVHGLGMLYSTTTDQMKCDYDAWFIRAREAEIHRAVLRSSAPSATEPRPAHAPCDPAQPEVSESPRQDSRQRRHARHAARTPPTYLPPCSPPAASTSSHNTPSGRASRSEGRAPPRRRGSWGRPPAQPRGEPAQLPLSYAPSNAFKGNPMHDATHPVSHVRGTPALLGRRTSRHGPTSSSTSRDAMAPSTSPMTSSIAAGYSGHPTWNGNYPASPSLSSVNRGRGSAHHGRDPEHPVWGPVDQQRSSAYPELEPAYHPAPPPQYHVVSARHPFAAAEGVQQPNGLNHQPKGFDHPSYPSFDHPQNSLPVSHPPQTDSSDDPSDSVSHSPPSEPRSRPAKKARPSPVPSISNTSRRSSMPSSSRRSPMPKSSTRPSTPRTHTRRGSGPVSPWRGSAPASAGYGSSSDFPSTPTSSHPSSDVFAPSPYAPTRSTHDFVKATHAAEASGPPPSSRASALHRESPGWASVSSSLAPSPSHTSAPPSRQDSAPSSYYVDSNGWPAAPPAHHARSVSEGATATSGESMKDAEFSVQLLQRPEVQAVIQRIAVAAALSAAEQTRSASARPLGSPFRHPSEPRTPAPRDSSASSSPWHSRNASGASTPPSASDSSLYASDPSSHQASAPGSDPELNGWLVDTAPVQHDVASHDRPTAPAYGEPCRGDPASEVGATDLNIAMRQMAFGSAPSESAPAHPGGSFERSDAGTDSSQGHAPQQDQAQNLGITVMSADSSELPQEWQGFSLLPSPPSAMLECPQTTEGTVQADGHAAALADTANNPNWHPWSEGMPASSPNLALPAPEPNPPSTFLPEFAEMPCQDGQSLSGNANSLQDNAAGMSMGDPTFLMDEDMMDPVYNTSGFPDYQSN